MRLTWKTKIYTNPRNNKRKIVIKNILDQLLTTLSFSEKRLDVSFVSKYRDTSDVASMVSLFVNKV